MLDLKEYMKKAPVTRKQYVDEWIDLGLIPGAVRSEDRREYSFPDSARRPYRDKHIKAGMTAPKIRAHMVKAAINRQYFHASTFLMSNGEFHTMINDLVTSGLLIERIEDEITYYDSTEKCDQYKNKRLEVLEKFVQGCIGAAAEGITKAWIAQAIASPQSHA